MTKNRLSLNTPSLYLNRELSALAFNQRVLSLAQDKAIPLLERLRYLFICSSNLDEFFEIRVAGLKEKVAFGSVQPSIDGLKPSQALQAISEKAHQLNAEIYDTYNSQLLPKLLKEQIFFLDTTKQSFAVRHWCKQYFEHEILPILSPIGLDRAHPFPMLINKSLNFIVSLEGKDAFGRDSGLAVVHAPRSLQRLIRLPSHLIKQGKNYVFLSQLISHFAAMLFPGMKINGCYQFRLTRNSDLFVDEEEADDLALALKRELLTRNFGNVVRIEVEKNCPDTITQFLLDTQQLTEDDLYFCDGPVNLNRYMSIIQDSSRDDLKFVPTLPVQPQGFHAKQDILAAIRERDILLHHPYESFETVINFIHQATNDEHVLAIKQTLYRIHAGSRMVNALIDAARAGKEVTAIIELRARFDEESNLELANRLHSAGVLVLYGVMGFKIHAKMTLIVRRENNELRRYVHLATGNYHESTARQYVDYGLLSYNAALTSDVQTIFQQLSGMGKTPQLKKLFHAPFTLNKQILSLIKAQRLQAANHHSASIIIKVNGITDSNVIKALYKASQAGVKITLFVRGLCRLRPGVPGVSDNIQVFSVMGRFLEHSRIYYFKCGEKEQLFLSSADLMERNLYHRVELLFPIESPLNISRIKAESLLNYMDNAGKRWQLTADGVYELTGKHNIQDKVLSSYQPPLPPRP